MAFTINDFVNLLGASNPAIRSVATVTQGLNGNLGSNVNPFSSNSGPMSGMSIGQGIGSSIFDALNGGAYSNDFNQVNGGKLSGSGQSQTVQATNQSTGPTGSQAQTPHYDTSPQYSGQVQSQFNPQQPAGSLGGQGTGTTPTTLGTDTTGTAEEEIILALIEGDQLQDNNGNVIADFSKLDPKVRAAVVKSLDEYAAAENGTTPQTTGPIQGPASDVNPPGTTYPKPGGIRSPGGSTSTPSPSEITVSSNQPGASKPSRDWSKEGYYVPEVIPPYYEEADYINAQNDLNPAKRSKIQSDFATIFNSMPGGK
jgi:hypothetical protein